MSSESEGKQVCGSAPGKVTMETSKDESSTVQQDRNSDACRDSIPCGWRTSVDRIGEVLASNPKLCEWGFDDGSWVCERFDEDRRRLERNRHDVLAASEWIARRTRRTKGITRWWSYGWKHVMERETGLYVTNGAFILAAIALGFTHTNEHNPSFNMGLIEEELPRRRA